MIEGVHFRPDWSGPGDVARKLVHVNLSDLAASGGEARWCLLNLGVPVAHDDTTPGKERRPSAFLPAFAAALREELTHNDCELIGGDTFRAPAYFLTLTMGGPTPRRLTRSSGRQTDSLYVTGELGGSRRGQRLLEQAGAQELTKLRESNDPAIQKHLRPRARLEWARKLREDPRVHAMMDVTDGLLQDAERLGRASRLELTVELERLPAAPDCSVEAALLSGEELELLFLAEGGLEFDFPCREIGRAAGGAPGLRLTRNGVAVAPPEHPGFEHFAR